METVQQIQDIKSQTEKHLVNIRKTKASLESLSDKLELEYNDLPEMVQDSSYGRGLETSADAFTEAVESLENADAELRESLSYIGEYRVHQSN